MVAKDANSQTSSRRATQLSLQRLFATPPTQAAGMPPMSGGLEAPAAPPLLGLPRLVPPMAVTTAMRPCCMHGASNMTWADWYQDVQSISIGLGQFYARCAACRAMDASFKDGPSP